MARKTTHVVLFHGGDSRVVHGEQQGLVGRRQGRRVAPAQLTHRLGDGRHMDDLDEHVDVLGVGVQEEGYLGRERMELACFGRGGTKVVPEEKGVPL